MPQLYRASEGYEEGTGRRVAAPAPPNVFLSIWPCPSSPLSSARSFVLSPQERECALPTCQAVIATDYGLDPAEAAHRGRRVDARRTTTVVGGPVA